MKTSLRLSLMLATLCFAAIETTNATDLAHLATVRCTVGGTCGTGTVVGKDATTAWILTNAHVAGTQRGKVINIQSWLPNGQSNRSTGTIEIAAYDDRTSTDWALLRSTAPALMAITPIPIDPTPSTFPEISTTGCPRCEWPSQRILSVAERKDRWRFQPIAVGGQSGSSLCTNQPSPKVVALLTWHDGRDGLAQSGARVAAQIRSRTTASDAGPVGTGFIRVIDGRETQPCQTGFFGPALTEAAAPPPIFDDVPQPQPDPIPDTPPDETPPKTPPNISPSNIQQWLAFVRLILQLLTALSRGQTSMNIEN